MAEPSPIRDNGPFQDAAQALKQYAAQTYGMPQGNEVLCNVVILEAALLTGVPVPEFEAAYLREALSHYHDPILSTLIAGWIIRAHQAGKTAR